MSWIRLTLLGHRVETWVDTDKIYCIRQNAVENKHSVLIAFKEDGHGALHYIDVVESTDEIMTMIDKPALLAEKIRNG